jgi:TolB-like protein/Tfp pilus assembly protein PilF
MMEADEAGTLARVKALRAELLHPMIAKYGGRIVKTMGDGTLVEFPSAVDAVSHAIDVQSAMAQRGAGEPEARRIVVRIGINVGDIVIDGDDIHGDGVNIAARLEGLAEPGGIYVSAAVQEHVRGKLDVAFDDLGEQTVKNIARPVRVYRVRPSQEAAVARQGDGLPLPDRPSIAVLPFQNMSGDPEQEYFADGIAEDIITGLSRYHWFFVIARNSSFTYKGRAVDVRTVGRELGVRYVLEGSVRKGGNRVRITAQLVEAATGNHLWAEKYDGALEDVFELQDKITEGVVGAIEPSVRQAEIERARRKKPENMDAYDLYLRALPHVWANTAPESIKAVTYLDEALRIDPSYAGAHGLAALCHALRFVQGGLDPAERTAALSHARAVLELGQDDGNALAFTGVVLANIARDFPAALGAVEKAVALNPNSARAHANRGWVQMMTERDDDSAMESCERAIRLSPFDPLNYGPQSALSIIYFRKGRLEDALEAAQRTIQISASFGIGHVMRAASCVRLGRLDDARNEVRRLLEIHPNYRLEAVRNVRYGGSATDSIVAALCEAGLPE